MEIIVNDFVFKFEFIDEKNIWYLGYNELDFIGIGYDIDITINAKEPNWDEIKLFLDFIVNNNALLKKLLTECNTKLRNFFFMLYNENTNIDIDLLDVFFTLGNIDYFEYSYNAGVFEYTLNFNIESKSDPDFFMYDNWNVHVRGFELISLNKS